MLSNNEVDNFLVKMGATSHAINQKNILRYMINGKSIAYVSSNVSPVRLSLRCDPVLGKSLIQKYESVMSAHNLDPKKWITIVLTGQLEDHEVFDLVIHAGVLIAEE